MSPPILSVSDLTKKFGSFRALDGVTLEVQPGSVFGLLGPNGAGKTTLIKILLGLVRGHGGKAELFGRPVGDPRARGRVGYLPETHRMPAYLTGRRALEILGMYAGRDLAFLRQRIPAWLDRVGMTKAADRKLRTYSKGMQQRIGLVQALVHDPDLIILDEPTDGVDPLGRAMIREVVDELRREGKTIFINSHLLNEVERISDRAVIMQRGKILREGTVEELTPRTGRVHVELGEPHPSEQELRRLVDGLGQRFEPEERGFSLGVTEAEQNEVIDRLRGDGRSILSVRPVRITLEQAFIDLVQKEG